MKTVQEAWEMYKETWEKDDVLGFYISALDIFLPYATIKDRLQIRVTPEEWDEDVLPITQETVLKVMQDYMEFAFEKAIDQRGISAIRSIQKYKVWLWLLGDEEFYSMLSQEDDYHSYGLPWLIKICQKYNFEIPEV